MMIKLQSKVDSEIITSFSSLYIGHWMTIYENRLEPALTESTDIRECTHRCHDNRLVAHTLLYLFICAFAIHLCTPSTDKGIYYAVSRAVTSFSNTCYGRGFSILPLFNTVLITCRDDGVDINSEQTKHKTTGAHVRASLLMRWPQ